jgi:hypothetical protein
MVAFGEWSFGEWSPSEIGRSEIGRSENGRSENGRCTVFFLLAVPVTLKNCWLQEQHHVDC